MSFSFLFVCFILLAGNFSHKVNANNTNVTYVSQVRDDLVANFSPLWDKYYSSSSIQTLGHIKNLTSDIHPSWSNITLTGNETLGDYAITIGWSSPIPQEWYHNRSMTPYNYSSSKVRVFYEVSGLVCTAEAKVCFFILNLKHIPGTCSWPECPSLPEYVGPQTFYGTIGGVLIFTIGISAVCFFRKRDDDGPSIDLDV